MSAAPRRNPRFPMRLVQLQGSSGSGAYEQGVPASLLRPQTPLRRAYAERAKPLPPAGLGMDSVEVRRRMVERLRQGGAKNETVLAAMAALPRHHFLDAALVTQAYEDTSLPIGHAQTISKPSIVARMLELLFDGARARELGHLGRVLEVGTGCGYQAALLAQLARFVISMERIKPLHVKARATMDGVACGHLRLVFGDGMLGHPPNAPYDTIIAAAGGDALPQAWLEQLALGGRLVVPMSQPGAQRQALVVIDRTETGIRQSLHEAVNFVPLKSGLVG